MVPSIGVRIPVPEHLNMRNIDIQATIWKEGKYYVSKCLNIDIASFGLTEKEALANLQEAIALRLENDN